MAHDSRKRVLVTGATGNMGSATLAELLARSDRFIVRALIRPEERQHPVVRRFAGNPALEITWGDLTRYDDVLAAVTGVDQVLHIGAMVSPLADHFPELTMRVNVGGTGNIVNAIKAQPDPDRVALIYIGTVAQTGHRGPGVHWGRTGDPIKISRFDTYAVSKTMAEALVAQSGLKRWASLRQTGIAHSAMWKVFDPIIFHNPLNGAFEWVTAGDAARLAANTCEDAVPAHFWRAFYNIGGGAALRLMNHEFAELTARALGARDWRASYLPHWFATRNFHGQWYADSDQLEAIVPFRRDGRAELAEVIGSQVPALVRLAGRWLPGLGRRRLRQLAEAPGGSLHWLANDDQAHIVAYFGSRQAWETLPRDWSEFVPAELSKEPVLLDHGPACDTAPDSWSGEDLRDAGAFRGSTLLSGGGDGPDAEAHWCCALGHEFRMTARLMLRGGHWCPTCSTNPDHYDAQALASPFFAQVWPDRDC